MKHLNESPQILSRPHPVLLRRLGAGAGECKNLYREFKNTEDSADRCCG